MGRSQYAGQAQRLGRFDVEQHADRLVHAIGKPVGAFGLFDGGGGAAHIVGALRLGQVDHVQARLHHSGNVSGEVGGVQRVDLDDKRHAARASPARAQQLAQCLARMRLAVLRHRVLEVERQAVCGAGERLVEQLRAGAGDEQFVSHGNLNRWH